MAVITKTIGTASRDYSTVQAWEDALPTTGTDSQVGECYNDSEFSTAGAIVTFAGTTTSSRTITLKCAAGQSFNDNASVQTNALWYTVSNGVCLKGNTGGYTNVLLISEDYVTLQDLQIRNDVAGSASGRTIYVTSSAYTHTRIDRCIVDGAAGNGLDGIVVMPAGIMTNSLVVHRAASVSTAGVSFSYPAAGTGAYNCTVVRPSDLAAGGNAFEALSGTASVVENCAGFGFTNFQNVASRFTGSNNCSDQTVDFGTSNQPSKTYANQFVATANNTGDFKLKAGSDCVDTGVTDATYGTPDIAKTARPSGSAYDIGCWELVAAVTTTYLLVAN